MNFCIKNLNLTKKKLAFGRGGDVGVARVSDFCLFPKESKSEKNVSFFKGVKVREVWQV